MADWHHYRVHGVNYTLIFWGLVVVWGGNVLWRCVL